MRAPEVAAFVRACADTMTEHRVELSRLDAAVGDADHGENLARGFTAAVAALPDPATATPTSVLKTVATTLISKVGGASGPLYGTAFLRAASTLDGRTELTPTDVVDALDAALGGIKARGKAEVGDKTMIDAWAPAVDAARSAAAGGAELAQVLQAAADAAQRGRDAVTPLVARKGRASYLGERAAGHPDPGATSTVLLLRCMTTCTTA